MKSSGGAGTEGRSIHQQENDVGSIKWSTGIAVKMDKSPKILSEKETEEYIQCGATFIKSKSIQKMLCSLPTYVEKITKTWMDLLTPILRREWNETGKEQGACAVYT